MPEAELQTKVLSLSNELLSTNTELQSIQEQLKNVIRESNLTKQRLGEQISANEALRLENAAQAQQVTTMENELADLSSSLVDEANQQVSEANRRAATAYRLVAERDDVITAQSAELLALKGMLERVTEWGNDAKSDSTPPPLGPSSGTNSPRPASTIRRRKDPDPSSEITQSLILDLDAYASPTRPLMRTDLPEFQDFQDLWGCQFNSPKPTLFHLPVDPWRKSVLVNRVIREDIEPTLRTDKSPHLSYLNMRQYVTSVMDLTIALEPVHSKDKAFSRRPSLPCVLCGELRGGDKYERVYRARLTPDGDKLVLDLGCVAKTRLACELAGFLRNVAKRPPASLPHQIMAWRQFNSMREQLFWARTGGLFPDADDLLEAVQHVGANDFAFDPQEDTPTVPTTPRNPSVLRDLGNTTITGTNAAGSEGASTTRTPTESESSVKDTNSTKPTEEQTSSTLPADPGTTDPKAANTTSINRVSTKLAKSTTNPNSSMDALSPEPPKSINTGAELKETSESPASSRDTPASASTSPAEVTEPIVLPKTKTDELSRPFVHLNASVESDLDVFQEVGENVPTK